MSIQTSNKYLRENLLLFYRLQEPSNSPRIDYANNLTATDNNTVQTVTGPTVLIPTAIECALANTEYLNIPYNGKFAQNRHVFVSAWVQIATKATFQAFVAHYDNNSTSNSSWYLYYSSSSDRIRFIGVNTAFTVSSTAASSAPTAGVWYHCTGWYEAGVGVGLRVNGAAASLVADTQGTLNQSPRDIMVGAARFGNNTSTAIPLDGKVAQPLVWYPTTEQLQYLKGPGTAELYNGGFGLAL